MKEKQDVGLEKMSYKFVKGYIEPIVALASCNFPSVNMGVHFNFDNFLFDLYHGSTWRT